MISEALKRLGSQVEEVPLSGQSLFVKPASLYYELDGV